MYDLCDIPFDKDLEFVSFDITNIYTNVPVTELIKIIEVLCEQNDEIIKMCKILLNEIKFNIEIHSTYKNKV